MTLRARVRDALWAARPVPVLVALLVLLCAEIPEADFKPRDPGVRGGPAGAGEPLSGLSPMEGASFLAGQEAFGEVDAVVNGLGPRFNLDSCGGCHAQPALGGSSPFVNPQVDVATKRGATNTVPFFISLQGPVLEARLRYYPDGTLDGGVTNLYTITGRKDARGCVLSQPDFAAEAARGNLTLRIPTPLFGAGLLEAIDDTTILANRADDVARKQALGIAGRPNLSGNDSTISRFGWKAQNKSLLMFAGEAYNVEIGVTNELFQTERDETVACRFNATPEDHTHLDAATPIDGTSDIVKFAMFARFLAPPTPAPDSPSVRRGRALFTATGCASCHTPSLRTGASSSPALRRQQARLFSDLLLHHMGPGLADYVIQADAGADEFRTAPLWGLGQRVFFLHDGRTGDLLEAIHAHASAGDAYFPASEANAVVAAFDALHGKDQQDILNFLRGL